VSSCLESLVFSSDDDDDDDRDDNDDQVVDCYRWPRHEELLGWCEALQALLAALSRYRWLGLEGAKSADDSHGAPEEHPGPLTEVRDFQCV
jgi:hypothetical protein